MCPVRSPELIHMWLPWFLRGSSHRAHLTKPRAAVVHAGTGGTQRALALVTLLPCLLSYSATEDHSVSGPAAQLPSCAPASEGRPPRHRSSWTLCGRDAKGGGRSLEGRTERSLPSRFPSWSPINLGQMDGRGEPASNRAAMSVLFVPFLGW